MSTKSQKTVYGTYTKAMRDHIKNCGYLGIVMTKADLINVYKEQERKNILEVPGYTGQNTRYYSLNVNSFLRREKAELLAYVKTKNNRMTGLWIFNNQRRNNDK